MNLGEWGENAAEKYLAKKGYQIIEKNFRCKIGEIDIIAKEDEVLVFVEVKTRKNLNYGLPSESITEAKLHHIKRNVQYYTLIKKLQWMDLRIDVIEILIRDGKAYIHHIINVE